MAIKKIREPIYDVDVIFICHEGKDKTIKWLEKNCQKNYPAKTHEERYNDSLGYCLLEHPHRFILVLTKDCHMHWEHTLAHEALHIASRTLRGIGMELCDESEEAFAYYIGWIVKECSKIYKQKGKQK